MKAISKQQDTARKRRDFIKINGQSRTRSIYILYIDGRSIGETTSLHQANQFVRGRHAQVSLYKAR